MNDKCGRCDGLPPPITSGPFKGSRHELRYCVFCSKDLCEACLRDGTCRETEHEDRRHRVEEDCPACGGVGVVASADVSGEDCAACEGIGTVEALVGGVRPSDLGPAT